MHLDPQCNKPIGHYAERLEALGMTTMSPCSQSIASHRIFYFILHAALNSCLTFINSDSIAFFLQSVCSSTALLIYCYSLVACIYLYDVRGPATNTNIGNRSI